MHKLKAWRWRNGKGRWGPSGHSYRRNGRAPGEMVTDHLKSRRKNCARFHHKYMQTRKGACQNWFKCYKMYTCGNIVMIQPPKYVKLLHLYIFVSTLISTEKLIHQEETPPCPSLHLWWKPPYFTRGQASTLNLRLVTSPVIIRGFIEQLVETDAENHSAKWNEGGRAVRARGVKDNTRKPQNQLTWAHRSSLSLNEEAGSLHGTD